MLFGYLGEHEVYLFCEVRDAIVEDDVVGTAAFFFFVHLLGHACFDLLGGGVVALHGSLQAERVGGIDEYGDIDCVLESCFEEDGAFLGHDGGVLPLCPMGEVFSHYGMDDSVHLGGMFVVGKEELRDGGLVELLPDIGVAADELA